MRAHLIIIIIIIKIKTKFYIDLNIIDGEKFYSLFYLALKTSNCLLNVLASGYIHIQLNNII